MSIGRITNLMATQQVLADINASQNRLDITQEQLSSGKKINQPSDDPYGASQAVSLNGQLSRLGDYSTNITDGTAWTPASDTALQSIQNEVQRVQELVVEAGQRHQLAVQPQRDQLRDHPADRGDQAGRQRPVQRPVHLLGHRDRHGAVHDLQRRLPGQHAARSTRTIGPGARRCHGQRRPLLGARQRAERRRRQAAQHAGQHLRPPDQR